MSVTSHILPASGTADAISNGYFRQVRFLLEFGHRPNERININNTGGYTPLMLCSMVKDKDWATSLARTLLEKGARVGLRDQRAGLNALHYACIYRCVELVKLYLQSMDCPMNAKDRFGNTALHHAAAAAHEEILRHIVQAFQRYDFSLSEQNKQGLTPLMCAWLSNSIPCGEFLKTFQKQSDEILRDVDGKTALDYEKDCRERVSQREEIARQRQLSRTLRFYEADAWQKQVKKSRSSQSTEDFQQTWKELQKNLNKARSVYVLHSLAKDQLEVVPPVATLQPASELDVRNVPDRLFPIDAVTLFSSNPSLTQTNSSNLQKEEKVRSNLSSEALLSNSGLQSISPEFHAKRTFTPRIVKDFQSNNFHQRIRPKSAAPKLKQTPRSTPSWRASVSEIFKVYEEQLSPNFCSPAVPPPVPTEDHLNFDDDNLDPQSPGGRHARRGSGSNKNSLSVSNKRLHRMGSITGLQQSNVSLVSSHCNPKLPSTNIHVAQSVMGSHANEHEGASVAKTPGSKNKRTEGLGKSHSRGINRPSM